METTAKIQKSMLANYNKQTAIYKMILSGARGSVAQLAQMAGMKGLMVDPAGNIIELPIRSNFKEGLNVFEYFISTHGSRKGRTDTALRTSESGYLTRRLIDVAQDIIITMEDCGAQEGLTIDASESEIVSETFSQRLSGRVLNEDLLKYKRGTYITDEIAKEIEKAGIEKVNVRSVIYCKAPFGVCQKCYGKDLATGELVTLGTVVGIMAAQAIGEPGTQLTMKTFHMGGVAGVDITTGLPRVEELFECRTPKNPAVLAEIAGLVSVDHREGVNIITITSPDYEREEYKLKKGVKLAVKNGERVKPKDILYSEEERVVRAGFEGVVEIKDESLILRSLHKRMRRYEVPENIELKVSSGEMVEVGRQLTEGHWDLASALKIVGKSRLASYIIREIKSIYTSQAQNISDKHLEIILRQIFSKVKILQPGDSEYLVGDIVSAKEVERVNLELAKKNKKKVVAEPMVMGITKVALKTDSFLSAASFQETINVLIEAAVEAKIDRLRGLKENVIIGRLIPAGTGFKVKDYAQ
jgi:DNA-directed RNA polymerase subunit beta'